MRKLLLDSVVAGLIVSAAAGGVTYPARAEMAICFLQNAAGVISPCPVDAAGNPISSSEPLAITPVAASTALASNQVLSALPATFYGAQVNNADTADKWVFLFNLAAAPSNGALSGGSVPVASWQLGAGRTMSISESPGLKLSVGIVLGCSSTGPFTYTASTQCTFGSGVVQ